MRSVGSLLVLFMGIALVSLSVARAETRTVQLYSASKEHLVRPILNQFTQDTGIEVKFTTIDRAGLTARLKLEGEDTPADAILVADVGNLAPLEEAGLLQPVFSETLLANLPEALRDDDNHWFGLAMRARVIFYAKDRIDPASIATYQDLAEPEWKGKLLIRSSSNIYNQSLMADMIYRLGEDKAKAWAKGIVANMARDPEGGDRDQLRALASGVADLAVANTYYYGLMQSGDDEQDKAYAAKLGMIFPNEVAGEGAHLNIRGGAVTKHAKNVDEAVALLEYLSQAKAQRFFSEQNREFPANPAVEPSDVVKAWGYTPKPRIKLSDYAANYRKAVAIMNEVGWQ